MSITVIAKIGSFTVVRMDSTSRSSVYHVQREGWMGNVFTSTFQGDAVEYAQSH